jgi:hypothetical protein
MTYDDMDALGKKVNELGKRYGIELHISGGSSAPDCFAAVFQLLLKMAGPQDPNG